MSIVKIDFADKADFPSPMTHAINMMHLTLEYVVNFDYTRKQTYWR